MDVPIIADIVASRDAADRDAVQGDIERAAGLVEKVRPRAKRGWRATAGDEFQAVYGSLADALVATLAIQLALPEGSACRFGIGMGEVHPVESSLADEIEDGPGWWSARAAVERAEEVGRPGDARTWFAPHETAGRDAEQTAGVVNAYLRLRDEVVSGMSDRARNVTFAIWHGEYQKDVAEREGISQAAVSQLINKPIIRALREGMAGLAGDQPS
ncbi:SatD family protein [Microbacterium sp. G2-8]|uniref:SatD family protein n=1 Tax=Microbacterium sp. G2-8 TaxID=2842454 RepID=UPI001C89BE2D|nr:SatD family protein [Microbacterium sp. G2-8]